MIQERGINLSLEEEEEPTKDSEVFFNPEMQLNRDISVSFLQTVQREEDKDFRVCDALSASGIRGLRYLDEVEGIKEIFINDKNPSAVESIEKNLKRNEVDTEKVVVSNKDANVLLSENKRRIDFIDIDPFGSPANFLDSTARALFREGYVGITATDLGPLYGSYVKTCMRRYGSRPLKSPFGHEIGMRILIKVIFDAFSRYDFNFRPLLSYYSQHYHRIFGKAYQSKKGANRSLENIGFASYCFECGYRELSEEKLNSCPECGGDLSYAGPLWTGNLGESDFCSKVKNDLRSRDYFEAAKLVEKLEKEYGINTLFYDTHNLAKITGKNVPKLEKLKQRIRKKGYKAELTHFSERSLKSEAPLSQIKDLV